MNTVDVMIYNQRYSLQCEPGQESELEVLAEDLSQRLTQLDASFGSRAESVSAQNMRLVITALMLLEEMKEARHNSRKRAGRDREELEAMIADILERIAGKLETLAG